MHTYSLQFLASLLAHLSLQGCQTAARQEAKQEGTSMKAQDEADYREMIKLTGAAPDAVLAATKQVDASRKWTKAKGGLIQKQAGWTWTFTPSLRP